MKIALHWNYRLKPPGVDVANSSWHQSENLPLAAAARRFPRAAFGRCRLRRPVTPARCWLPTAPAPHTLCRRPGSDEEKPSVLALSECLCVENAVGSLSFMWPRCLLQLFFNHLILVRVSPCAPWPASATRTNHARKSSLHIDAGTLCNRPVTLNGWSATSDTLDSVMNRQTDTQIAEFLPLPWHNFYPIFGTDSRVEPASGVNLRHVFSLSFPNSTLRPRICTLAHSRVAPSLAKRSTAQDD